MLRMESLINNGLDDDYSLLFSENSKMMQIIQYSGKFDFFGKLRSIQSGVHSKMSNKRN